MHVQTVEYHMSNVHNMLLMTANDQIYSSFQFSLVLMRIHSIVCHKISHLTCTIQNTTFNIYKH